MRPIPILIVLLVAGLLAAGCTSSSAPAKTKVPGAATPGPELTTPVRPVFTTPVIAQSAEAGITVIAETDTANASRVSINPCPSARPFRCPDGYCALASADCPMRAQVGNCSDGTVRCP